jgi:hypothetical protein
MFYNIVQKYFNGVVAWLGDLNLFKRAIHSDFLIESRRFVGMKVSDGAFINGHICVLDADHEKVIQRVAMGEVDGNGNPKKIWINVTLTAREAVDVG